MTAVTSLANELCGDVSQKYCTYLLLRVNLLKIFRTLIGLNVFKHCGY